MTYKDLSLLAEDQLILDYYRSRIISTAISEFEYGNLPATCDRLYMERKGLENGAFAMYVPRGSDILVATGFAQQGNFTGYAYPDHIVGVDFNGRVYETDEFEICYDNVLKVSLMPYIEIMARQLWEAHQTYRSNLAQQITPFVKVSTSKDQKLNDTNIFNQIFGFAKFLLVKNPQEVQNIKTIDTKVPYIGLDLLQSKQVLWRDIMSMLGITIGTTKRERQSDDELRMNRMADAISMQSRLSTRVDFCNRVNRRWGLDLTVNLVGSVYEGDTDPEDPADEPREEIIEEVSDG